MRIPDLLAMADQVAELVETPAWKFVMGQVAVHEQKMLARLLNESTKPEEIPRLRGLISGLASGREAAESVMAFAAEAERKANERQQAQEQLA